MGILSVGRPGRRTSVVSGPQTKISRRHARIFRKGDTYLVEDLGSVNGTVINDTLRLAPHQPLALESGDKLRVGETTLHFLIG